MADDPAPYWQTASRPSGVQKIPGGMVWTPVWTLDAQGKRITSLPCEVDGPYDIDWAVRVLPGKGGIWFRVQRHPIDPEDRGTRWVGPITLGTLHLYAALRGRDLACW
jgi:hypothetical protein